MRRSARGTRVAAIALVASSGVALTACAPEVTESAHFALTSASVVGHADSTFPVNLILVADTSDVIFTDYAGVSVDGVGHFDETSAPLDRGETRGGISLASISFEVAFAEAPFGFSQVTVDLKNGDSQVHDVGEWRFAQRAPGAGEITALEWPSVIPECSEFGSELSGLPEDGGPFSAIVDQPGVTLLPGSAVEYDGGETAHTNIDLACSSAYDFFVVSIELRGQGADGGAGGSSWLDPIMIGHMGISDDDISRIQSR